MGAVDDGRAAANPTIVDGAVPTSVSDVLHLMAVQHLTGFAPEILQKLGRAHLAFIRGTPVTALRLVNQVIEVLDPDRAADALAFRLFLRNMMVDDALRPTSQEIETASRRGGPLGVVALCIRSNGVWHSGNLFQGLWLNHSALQRTQEVAGIWQFYAGLQMTKKLINLRISHQASRLVGELCSLVDGSGLYAFGSLPDALHSVMHLQVGELARAAETAKSAIRMARQRGTVVGTAVSLSVSAQAHIGLGELDRAAADLAAYRCLPRHYGRPDSAARAVTAGIALLAAREGAEAAAGLMRAEWPLLAAGSACFIEDLGRPAWLVTVARRAGDIELAERVLSAAERLAAANPDVPLLEKAAGHARTAFAGQRPSCPFVLDLPASPRRRDVLARSAVPADSPSSPGDGSGERDQCRSRPAEESESSSIPEPRLSSLSQRESEIARLVGSGLTNQQVACQLGVSPHTVNFHLRSIFRKLAISTRVNLGQLLVRSGQEECPAPRRDPADEVGRPRRT